MALKPNQKYLCIAQCFEFTIGNTYTTTDEGMIIDDDQDERAVLSEEDDYFFERFKEL